MAEISGSFPRRPAAAAVESHGVEERTMAPLRRLRRLALVTGNYVTAADGASVTLHRLVDALLDRGVEVAVVAPTKGHVELPFAPIMFSVPSVAVPKQGYRFPLGLGLSAREQLSRFEPQLVHVASPDLASWGAMRWAKRRGIPVTSSFHTNFAAYLKYWSRWTAPLVPVAWRILARFYESCDRVFVPTESMGEELVANGVLDEWASLARGVEADRFDPKFRSKAWRQRYGIGADERVALFCARIVWEKGLMTLAEAMREVQARVPNARVVIVGDGDQRAWLERQLPDATFTGYLDGRDLAEAYASSDLFVYPSTTDTFGNVTLEAMASGLAVIGADAPGTRSVVVDGESGLLVPPDDASALADATVRLLQDDFRRKRLSRGAHRRSKEFRWPAILDQFAMDLDDVVVASDPPDPASKPDGFRAELPTRSTWFPFPL